MIYILYGNDRIKKNIFLKNIYKNTIPIYINNEDIKREVLLNYAQSINLFGDEIVVIVENFFVEGEVNLSSSDLTILNDSKTTFIFKEDSLSTKEIKDLSKYAKVVDFTLINTKKIMKMNVFGIADSFMRKDKITTWILFRELIENDIPPEEISGIIFWKVKTMILNGNKYFTQEELKKISSNIVSIYHNAHSGKLDFVIGLEQFILNSLNK